MRPHPTHPLRYATVGYLTLIQSCVLHFEEKNIKRGKNVNSCAVASTSSTYNHNDQDPIIKIQSVTFEDSHHYLEISQETKNCSR